MQGGGVTKVVRLLQATLHMMWEAATKDEVSVGTVVLNQNHTTVSRSDDACSLSTSCVVY
jgi:hypothetical protein